MKPLTEGIPKSLLRVGDRLVLDWLIESVRARTEGELVVVTGYESAKVEEHVAGRYGARVALVENERYRDDVNVLSVETGVEHLQYPERGYLIVETDLLVDESSWATIFSAMESGASGWVCRGRYSESLTGGIVHAGPDGNIDGVEYQPVYDAAFEGWNKMLGMLFVGPAQVETDRRVRQAAIKETTKQYYLTPWQKNVKQLPSRVISLDESSAAAFNTVADFEYASAQFLSSQTVNTTDPHVI